jgi:8-oxo-dGTP pyrophosphatase MutT (NUDIX family)
LALAPVEQRNAVRAILLTPDEEVLLIRLRSPATGEFFWVTPGGGLEAGETSEQGLRRELREELGLELMDLGAVVWRRHHEFSWRDRRILQREEIRLIRTLRFEPVMSDPVEAEVVDSFRWWPVAALSDCPESITPRALQTIVANYLKHGAPAEPLEVERLVD